MANLVKIDEQTKEQFMLACQEAGQLQLVENFGAAFNAVIVINRLRELLTDDLINQVFRPLMNTKIGFLTDHDPKRPRKDRNGNPMPVKEYDNAVIRDAIIEAASYGLLPTGNQFNIISERMYPTKEGYNALLSKLGVKNFIAVGMDTGRLEGSAEIPVKVDYMYKGDKGGFTITAIVKKDGFSSYDQLAGKAERRALKSLYKYITGCDLGDADEHSSDPIDAEATVISTSPADANAQKIGVGAPAAAPQNPAAAPQNNAGPAAPQRPTAQPVGQQQRPSVFGGQA